MVDTRRSRKSSMEESSMIETKKPSNIDKNISKKGKAKSKRKPREYELYSRCSPTFFHKTMETLKVKMGPKQLEGIRKTPFHHFLEMPKLNASSLRVEALLKRFKVKNLSFIFGENVEVPFSAAEFSLVLGLHYVGQAVDLSLEMESSVVERLFSGEIRNVKRTEIARLLVEYATKDSDDSVDDFCRLYILFVFNCIIFPTSNYWTPSFLLPYVDDLSRVGLYAWGEAAYNFVVSEIRKHLGGVVGEEEKKKYFDGCTIALMAWLYERVPSLGTQRSLYEFPRFFRWNESKLPYDRRAAEELLSKITRDKVLPLNPMPEEEKLVSPIVVPAAAPVGVAVNEQASIDFQVLEAIIDARDKEIDTLKRKISELEEMKGKTVEKKKAVKRKRGKKKKEEKNEERKTDEGSDDDMTAEHRTKRRNDVMSPIGASSQFVELPPDVDAPSQVDDQPQKADLGGWEVGGQPLEMDAPGNVLEQTSAAVLGGREVSEQPPEIDVPGGVDELTPAADLQGREVGEHPPEIDAPGNVLEQTAAADLGGREVSEQARDIDEQAHGHDEKARATDEYPQADELSVANFMSSIVQDVQTREDRKMKRKEEDFVTPPTTTPPKRFKELVIRGRGRGRGRGRQGGKKVKKGLLIDISKSTGEKTPRKFVELWQGRTDYRGRNEIPDIERELLDMYLTREDLGNTIWEGDGCIVERRFFGELLFGETLCGDILDVWMCILRSPSVRSECDHDLWSMSTIVQGEVLMKLNQQTIESVTDDAYANIINEFSSTSKRLLREINIDVLSRCRYVIIPICTDFHWYLLVLDTSRRTFILMNSILAPRYKSSTNIIAKFYSRYFRQVCDFHVEEEIEVRHCRQQEGTMDCGVYVCLWAECFARDKENFWSFAENCSIDSFRAHMACTILRHENGVLH